ncbi:uncharacterized protein BYT42DRAFT_130810 [Radiomyces spectabilis]|uniref:uncharacterized protein n=1 Tax=Radiomyces spectabilis TaxID=64574 RepID=UPI00222018CA|nr:uncharacterized protein BYT42DRAFT_130810 [Radiomyces spectabilis]KAI8367557.1 hypothetical protein BYT42DRAFT_130810 [Radiomyces spectabilis]
MNTMSFGSFHAKHFNPDEVLRWKNFIFGGHAMPVNAYPTTDAYYSYPATDAQGYYADSDHGIPQTHAPNSEYIETFDIPKGEEDQVIQEGEQEEVYEEGEEYGEDDEEEMVYHGTLSKEAVEIFRFSEAYRKERFGQGK